VKLRADDCLQFRDSDLVIAQMFAGCRLDIAQVSLRADPVEKRRFSGFVAQSCRLDCLPRLRHELVTEQLDVMMKRFDLCQLISQQSQRFLLFALKTLLGGCKVRACLAYSGGVFRRIYPWDCERHASIEFAYRFCGIIVSLAFYH